MVLRGKGSPNSIFSERIIFDRMLEFSLSMAYTALALYFIGRWKLFAHPHLSSMMFKVIFLLKIMAALALYFIYTQFYTDRSTADIFRYYDDSAILYDALLKQPWNFIRMLSGIQSDAPELLPYYDRMNNWYNTDLVFNDSRTMIRLNAFLRCFSVGTYFPHAVVMCFFAFVGLTGLFRVMDRLAPGRELHLLLCVYLLPSTLIWTSGMIKEAFLVFAMGWLLYGMSEMLNGAKVGAKHAVVLAIPVFLLLSVKAYVFFMLIPVLLISYLAHKFQTFGRREGIIIIGLYFLILIMAAPLVAGRTAPVLLAEKQAEFFHVAEVGKAGSLVEIPRLDGTWKELISDMPGAFFRTLTLPLPGQAHNFLMYFAVIENFLIWLLMLAGIRNLFKQGLQSPLNWAFLSFACALFILSGLVTPVIGALVRYKVPALPFLLFPFVQAYPLARNRAGLLPAAFRNKQ
jgi:hypothetical protein